MAKTRVFGWSLAVALFALPATSAAQNMGQDKGRNAGCVTIQDGVLADQKGFPLLPGFDEYGYNYQGHQFSGPGLLDNLKRVTPSGNMFDDHVEIKWNDAFLSNKDCGRPGGGEPDGALDRPVSYFGSGAWVTNHWSGNCDYGKRWTYSARIVAVPKGAESRPDDHGAQTWYLEGQRIGYVVWDLPFAVTEEVANATCPGTDANGVIHATRKRLVAPVPPR